MKTLNLSSFVKANLGPTVVTLGNFDGVHLGHRALFQKVIQAAERLNASSAVFTFEPHPLKLLAPERAPLLINTAAEKRQLISQSGIDLLVEEPFTSEFSSISPDEFVANILIKTLQVKAVVVGYDYAFGHKRSGTVEFLQSFGRQSGFEVEVMAPVRSGEILYSSTNIRKLVTAGHVSAVTDLLGRYFSLEGIVVPGDRRGRQLGYPTANIETEKELLPAAGVYAVQIEYADGCYDGVASLGVRPTFGENAPSIEVHFLDFSGNLYGRRLRVHFVERIRDEKKFENLSSLADAIRSDVEKSRAILAHHRRTG